jgi:hypothetical protein
VLEEDAHRKYLEHAKVPVEALARLAAGDCSIAAAAAAVVAVVVVAAPAVAAADVEPAAAVVAAADAAVLVVAAVVEAQELVSFVADHQMSPTLR